MCFITRHFIIVFILSNSSLYILDMEIRHYKCYLKCREKSGNFINNLKGNKMNCDNYIENECKDLKADVIQPISRDTVHRICSGQVVLSLAVAVKELVENAIDASATNIEVRLVEYGSELLEVSDNGSGVRKENFTALTLKHYTSKIRQFTDLESVSTLGFRGEALSSLCALADLSIISKHSSAEHATKIVYDHNGKIVSESPTARQEGTTVTLSNLFKTLPVRRKEFMKNLKKEFNKMSQLLTAYCLCSKGIKITCTNQTSKGSKNVVLATQGCNTVRENIIAIFGAKQISSLVDVTLQVPEEHIFEEFGVKRAVGEPIPFTFEWFISSVTHGSGRSATDRQFYYINGRPCEPTKVMKLVNEIYRQFNGNQYPFVYLNINTETNQIDVNVTPDKRQIFLEKEKVLLATVKASLLEIFKQFPSTYKIQNSDISKRLEESMKEKNSSPSLKRSLSDVSNGLSDAKSMLDLFRKKPKTEDNSTENDKNCNKKGTSPASSQKTFKTLEKFNIVKLPPLIDVSPSCRKEKHSEEKEILDCKLSSSNIKEEFVVNLNFVKNEQSTQKTVNSLNTSLPSTSAKFESPQKDVMYHLVTTDSEKPKPLKPSISMETSMEAVRTALKKVQIKKEKDEESVNIKFRSEISPQSNKSAEEELNKQITKDMFAKMEVIGQFNLAFIIAKLEDDLFIIDQHASDEKFNFEKLQETTVLENQLLVNPKSLQLTSANEELLIENEEIFRKNGFTFKIDHTAEATKKVSLTAIPVSKNYAFGKDDIDEMLFILQDNNNTMVRPSRIRSMFASRACRKSVMVGRSLSKSEMKRLIEHMGVIDQPWNCPHGRPTMRHLINLSLIHQQ